ncbi:autotransporter outer membrane beta-barrel domain-containing protein [Asticcacaulis sp.]|uniref:autotransporter outer membrane beta-barrel domain-containing protein n=1 Tax=Asticcacaulis sp. TaxID=1872648 RepID=UPI002BA28A34|nr:autotransporter outer membrane beta-barrel domain-containing protein [Asticcacaulis sp.]HTM79504.1 autotransporter outer membrane beta-barrel domain-containing protein [Asticcacaulis sp.]
MRKHTLLTATALGLVLGGGGLISQAFAETSVSTATTTPLLTSTSGDLTVTSDGSITLTSGTAITVDSNNMLDFEGSIAMSGSDSGSTGILITDFPDRTKGLTLTGDITVTDDYTATDTTSLDGSEDGYTDSPWAEGTGRYGIRSTGASPFVGDVYISSDSAIDVEGNQSYGIRFENQVKGAFTYDGAMTLIGDNSIGISLEKGVTGNVYLSGSVSTLGANASAIKLTGDLGGNLIIDGSYSGTAYSSTSALTQAIYENLIPANNLLQDGPLVTIAGNVANGVLLGSSVTSTDDDNADEDGDGLVDTSQSTASLTQYGSAPALAIGSTTGNITLGGLTYASTSIDPPSVNYGLLNRGSIGAYGVHPGVDATALQIGGTGYTTTIDNGIGVTGSVTSSAYGGDATSISLLSGATTPRLDINGTVTATTTRYLTSAEDTDGNTVYTVSNVGKATAVSIAAGASLPAVKVAASSGIYASSSGSTGSATAISDASGTLTSITNNGTISATITATDDDGDGTTDAITGKATAIDLSANTTGVTITQVDNNATDSDDDTAIAAPYIYGNILFGAGNDALSSSGGYIYGNIDYGAGAGSFTLTNDAVFLGKLTSDGEISMDIDSGASAGLLVGSAVKVSSLHVGSDSALALTLATATPTVPILSGSGAAVFDNGARLYLTLDKILTTPTSFTILTGSSIDLGDMTTSTLDGYIPYLYHSDLTLNDTDTVLTANFRLKTQGEAGYSANQYAALMPVLAVVAEDTGAKSSLLAATNKDAFDQIYNQYLPDYSGENLISLSVGSASLNRSLSNLTLVPDNNGGQYWLQEYGYGINRSYSDTAGFKSTGFSFAGGREKQVYGNQMVGTYLSITSASPRDTFALAAEGLSNSDLTLGVYWRLNTSNLKAWMHAGAGYDTFKSTRNILTTTVSHVATAKWDGYSVSGGAGASYDYNLGKWGVTPQVLIDYYQLNENKHAESGGGDYFDLTVGERDGHLLTSTALLNLSYKTSFLKPELWIGYKQNLSATLPDTVANFTGGDSFTLVGGNIEGGGPVAGFRLSADNPYSYFSIEAEYQQLPEYTNTSVSLRTRFQF